LGIKQVETRNVDSSENSAISGGKSSEVLLSSIIPFAGSGLGYAMGFALKKKT
jgi:hypothetical protein